MVGYVFHYIACVLFWYYPYFIPGEPLNNTNISYICFHMLVTYILTFVDIRSLWCIFCRVYRCWYQVVMGWCIFYTYQVTVHPLPTTVQQSTELFEHYIDVSWITL
jgi:hypothetical protein